MVILEVCFEMLLRNDPTLSHVLVSLAQVVSILAQVSPEDGLEMFVKLVVGFDTLVIDILSKRYSPY